MKLSIENLRVRLTQSLPSTSSHQKMMKHRLPIDQIDAEKLNAKKSAVLITMYPYQNDIHIVLTKRAEYKGVHSGQISLPGGKVEDQDRNLEQTALREAQEEIGIDPAKVDLIGSLSQLYIPPSNFIVQPFVGFMSEEPLMKAEEKEVDQIIRVPLSFLMESKNIKAAKVSTTNGTFQVNAFHYEGHVIWGATSMILAEFADVLNELA